eukprot:12924338-Prorocentrum_lima.AAC.1
MPVVVAQLLPAAAPAAAHGSLLGCLLGTLPDAPAPLAYRRHRSGVLGRELFWQFCPRVRSGVP